MKLTATLALLAVVAAAPAAGISPTTLDSLYQLYVVGDYAGAGALLERLETDAKGAAEQLAVGIERGDFLLDKLHDYIAAESVYAGLLARFPKDRQVPTVLYRLALAQEMREDFLEAARNYEKVATQYQKSDFADDALDAIERCFRKNYQDRVAYVDGFPITRIELDDRISRSPAQYETFASKQQLLDTMIDNRLLYQAALAANVTADPAFQAGINDARNRAMFQSWYEQAVTGRAQPTDKEVKAAYNRDLKTRYTTPEKVRAYQIRVATRAEADSLRNLLLGDTALTWDTIAKTNSLAPDKSQGGDMGLFARGVQPKPIEDAAFRLKVGEVSKPVAIEDNWVLLKVTDRQAKTVRKFDEVKSQIAADMRQQNVQRLYDQVVEELKQAADIARDSMAMEEGRDTIATVNGFVIDAALLAERLEAIPPFFRAQFDSPEGRNRIVDQLILEKLFGKESERRKLWLQNKVVDQVLARRAALLHETYIRDAVTGKVTVDSAEAMADYQATLDEFKEPAKVHVREIAATTRARAEQLRRWARAGRLPQLIQGRALLVTDPAAADEAAAGLAANSDSAVAAAALAGSPALPGRPVIQVSNKSVPDLSRSSAATGAFGPGAVLGFGFSEVSREDALYQPEPFPVQDEAELTALIGPPDSSGYDSSQLGTYVKAVKPIAPAAFKALFGLDDKAGPNAIETPAGRLLVKVTKNDSAQKAAFADIARRFSTAGTRWSGGDWSWVTRDDKSHDNRLVAAAFGQAEKAISTVVKVNDSTYAFVLTEEKKAARTRPFEEVRGKIENKLRRQEEKALNEALVTELRSKAKIETLMKESDFEIEPLPGEPAEPTPQQE